MTVSRTLFLLIVLDAMKLYLVCVLESSRNVCYLKSRYFHYDDFFKIISTLIHTPSVEYLENTEKHKGQNKSHYSLTQS